MLKETETEETLGFFDTFLSMVAFQFGEWVPCAPLLATLMIVIKAPLQMPKPLILNI